MSSSPTYEEVTYSIDMKRLPALPSLYKPRAGLTQGLLTPAEWNTSLLGDAWFGSLVDWREVGWF